VYGQLVLNISLGLSCDIKHAHETVYMQDGLYVTTTRQIPLPHFHSLKMSSVTSPLVGVILCSSRQPRVCPQVAAFVMETFENWTSSLSNEFHSPTSVKLHLIDLAVWALPLFDEPTIPSQVTSHSDYGQAHTRAWSEEIQKYFAFIFILPQYNWGYPAVIKNAIDYLFNEWHGKPAIIVSYGGHGGVKAASQLRQVLQGVRMNVVETMPALTFPSKKVLLQATKGEQIGVLGEAGIWNSEREGICKAFEELMVLVSPSEVSNGFDTREEHHKTAG
jgi:NAD(P)H-dependent FMN reductase